MPHVEGQKGKILWILRFLEKYTDEDHSLSAPQLLDLLAEQGIKAERKSIYSDIETLQSMGYDIEQQRGRFGGFKLVSREFQLPELKLLVDAVQASRFITRKKSDQLIRTLARFASDWQAADLKRQVFASGRVKTMNESIYYNVDALHRAIAQDRQVEFIYQDWDIGKKKVARHGGSPYRVSPWALLWEDENYYLVAYAEGQGMRHYRVDKMAAIELLDAPRLGARAYDPKAMQDYAKPMFNMYGGPVTRVELHCDGGVIGPMLDRFGPEATVVPQPDGSFHLHARVAVSPTFFGWVCGFGGKVRVAAPQAVKEDFCRMLDTLRQSEAEL